MRSVIDRSESGAMRTREQYKFKSPYPAYTELVIYIEICSVLCLPKYLFYLGGSCNLLAMEVLISVPHNPSVQGSNISSNLPSLLVSLQSTCHRGTVSVLSESRGYKWNNTSKKQPSLLVLIWYVTFEGHGSTRELRIYTTIPPYMSGM